MQVLIFSQLADHNLPDLFSPVLLHLFSTGYWRFKTLIIDHTKYRIIYISSNTVLLYNYKMWSYFMGCSKILRFLSYIFTCLFRTWPILAFYDGILTHCRAQWLLWPMSLRNTCSRSQLGMVVVQWFLSRTSGWWFQAFFIFTPIWGRFPFWLLFIRWVETTN